MTELDRTKFFTELNKILSLRNRKPLNADQMATWWRALKEHPLTKVLDALDQHVKYSTVVPVPAHVTARIIGKTERGDAKESTPSKDRRCCYEQNGERCEAPTAYFTFGNRGYCSEHERASGDPLHMQQILDNHRANGVPGDPPSPQRQRAEYLYAKGGAELVLTGVVDPDGTRWGPYDQRMVDWLRKAEARGGVKAWSYVSPHRPVSVAEAVLAAAQPLEPELEF